MAAEEQGTVEAVQGDQGFAAVGSGLDFVELRLREVALGLGDEQGGGFADAVFLPLGAEFLGLQAARGGGGFALRHAALDLDVRVADIALHEQAQVIEREPELFARQGGAFELRGALAAAHRPVAGKADREVIAVAGLAMERTAEAVGVAAAAEADEEVQPWQQAVLRLDHIELVALEREQGLVQFRAHA